MSRAPVARPLLGPVVVLRTPYGRWKWWPALNVIDYHPKGERHPETSIGVSRATTLTDAVRLAARREGQLARPYDGLPTLPPGRAGGGDTPQGASRGRG